MESIRTEATADKVNARTTPDGAGERVDLPLTGMTCAACARRIERRLKKTPGVSRAGVNFATARATVEYDPRATGVGQLIAAVKDVGYGTAGAARADFVVDDSARPAGSGSKRRRVLRRSRGTASRRSSWAAACCWGISS